MAKRLLVALVVVAVFCATAVYWRVTQMQLSASDMQLRHSATSAQDSIKLDIYEAVFRYQIAQNPKIGTVFLRIDGHDPSDDFLKRFTGLGRRIKRASESGVTPNDTPRFVHDPSDGSPALILDVDGINWMSPGEAEVSGGVHCGSTCYQGGIYSLAKQNRLWKVYKFKPGLVS